MKRERSSPKILFVAGEPSGDAHAAAVVRAIRKRSPQARIAAAGGAALAEAGAKIVSNLAQSAVTGFTEVIRHLPKIAEASLTILTAAERADLVVFVDYPGLNVRLAQRIARRPNRPRLLYYIAPQVWAWNSSRARVLSKILDRIAVVFPFEVSLFSNAVFVGHPLLDLPRPEPDPRFAGSDTVALLPGSRWNELRRHWDLFVETARILEERGKRPVLSIAHSDWLSRIPPAPFETAVGSPRRLLASAERAVVKSGTATLEAALLGVPFVTVYRLSTPSYVVGRWLVDVPHIAMPNILLDDRVVPELIQDAATPQAIVHQLFHLDSAAIREKFRRLPEILGPPGCAERVADLCIELAERKPETFSAASEGDEGGGNEAGENSE